MELNEIQKWLLMAVMTGPRVVSRMFGSKQSIRELINCKPYDESKEDAASALIWLCEHDFVTVWREGKQRNLLLSVGESVGVIQECKVEFLGDIYFQLTKRGGEVLEEEGDVKWDEFVTAYSLPETNDQSAEFRIWTDWIIEAATPELIERKIGSWRAVLENELLAATRSVDLAEHYLSKTGGLERIEPWQATYWKELSTGFRQRVRETEWKKESE